MSSKISQNEIVEIIKKGYDLNLISLEFDIPLSILKKYRKIVEDDAKLNSKEIKRLIKLRKYNEALILTEKYSNNPVIQSQRIKIYIKTRKYEKAKGIGKKFENDAPIQSQMMTIAIEEGKYEEAKEIGKKFENDAQIQSQMITIAIKEGKYEEYAIEKLKDYNPFQVETKNENNEENIELLNKIKTMMYYELDKIEKEKIVKNDKLTEKQKLYIMLAIYEKEKNVKEIKKIRGQYKESNESKNINKIFQKTQSKKTQIFDWTIYDAELKWNIDENLKRKYEQKIKEQKEQKIRQAKEEKMKQKIKEDKRQEERRKRINIKVKSRENETSTSIKMIQSRNKDENLARSEFRQKIKVQEDLDKKCKVREEKNNYNEVLNFLLEKRTEVYLKMQSADYILQKKGIEQWDKLEELIEKTKLLKENVVYINGIYEKIAKLREKEEMQR